MRPFRISWVLRGELAVGPAPRRLLHAVALQEQGVKAVLSLCTVEEAPAPPELGQFFLCRRFPLPDHHSGRAPESAELNEALALLRQLAPTGPVFVHCLAGVERSPLVCMAWLMQRRRLRRLEALDYMMQVHPSTGVLPQQLALLANIAPRPYSNSPGES